MNARFSKGTGGQFVGLLLSRGLALIVGFVSSFVFVLHMSQETFGTYRYAVNLLNTVVVFAAIGVPITASRVLLAKPDASSMKPVYGFAVRTTLLTSLASSAAVFLVMLGLQRAGLLAPAPGLMLAIPLVYTLALQGLFVTMFQGSNRIGDISLQTLLPPVGLLTGVLLLGSLRGPLSIVEVLVLFGVVYTAVHLLTILRLRIPALRPTAPELRDELKTEHRANGWPIYLGSLIGVASSYVINVVLGAFSGMSDYALFGLALSLSAPMQFIPSVMGTIQFRRNARAGRMSPRNIAGTIGLTVTALAAYLLVVGFVLPFYPDAYAGALTFIIVLSSYYAMIGLGDYFNRFVLAHGHGRLINLGAVVSGLCNLAFSLLGMYLAGIPGAVVARAVSGIVYLVFMVLAYRWTVQGGSDATLG